MSYTVYKHTNIKNGKVYIGLTGQELQKRWRRNGVGYKSNPRFYNAIKKYGWDNFNHEVIEEGLTLDEAKERETFFIRKYKSNNRRYGYNLTEGGEHNVPNDEVKKKLSKTQKSRLTEEKRQKFREIALSLNYSGKRNPFYGCKHSEVTRKKMSENHWSKKEPEKFLKELMKRVKKGEESPFAVKVIRVCDEKTYNTVTLCAQDNNVTPDTVTAYCRGKRKYFRFMYLKEFNAFSSEAKEEVVKRTQNFESNLKKYLYRNKEVISIETQKVFQNVQECAGETKHTSATIIAYCKGRRDVPLYMYKTEWDVLSDKDKLRITNKVNNFKKNPVIFNVNSKKVVRLEDGLVIDSVKACEKLKIASGHTVKKHCDNTLSEKYRRKFMWFNDYQKLSTLEKERLKKELACTLKRVDDRIIRLFDRKVYNTASECASENKVKRESIISFCSRKDRYMYLRDFLKEEQSE